MAGAEDDAAARRVHERNKGLIFKNCGLFINCKTETDNTEIDNAKDIHIAIPIYNLIEYGDIYLKTSGSFWQYYRDEPNVNITDSESFKSKIKMIGNTSGNNNRKDLETFK